MTLTDTQNKRQFILDTLLPYKQDRNLCAYEGGKCKYLTDDGRKCAVGKHMKEGEWQHFVGSFSQVAHVYGRDTMFTDEALQVSLTAHEWDLVQLYHDRLVKGGHINSAVRLLEEVTNLKFPELLC
jgi:hypothetical protein